MARLSSFCNAAGKDRNRGLQKGPSFSFPSSVSLSLAHFFLFPPFHILPLLSHTHIVNTRHRPCEVGPTFSPDPPPSTPATPHPTCLTTTSTVRDSAPLRQDGPSSSVLSDPPKRRQLLQKTGAARRIIILLYCHWVPPPPPSLLFLFFTLSPSFLILEPNVTTLGTFGRA